MSEETDIEAWAKKYDDPRKSVRVRLYEDIMILAISKKMPCGSLGYEIAYSTEALTSALSGWRTMLASGIKNARRQLKEVSRGNYAQDQAG